MKEIKQLGKKIFIESLVIFVPLIILVIIARLIVLVNLKLDNSQLYWTEGIVQEDFKGGESYGDPYPIDEAKLIRTKAVEIPKEVKFKHLEIVGEIILKKAKLLFVPIYIHHMAAEFWSLSGSKVKELEKRLRPNTQYYIKIKGIRFWKECRLAYGSQRHIDFVIGKGFHIRKYDFEIEEIIWIKTKEEFEKVEKIIEYLQRKKQIKEEKLKYQEALAISKKLLELKKNLWVLPREEEYINAEFKYLKIMSDVERDLQNLKNSLTRRKKEDVSYYIKMYLKMRDYLNSLHSISHSIPSSYSQILSQVRILSLERIIQMSEEPVLSIIEDESFSYYLIEDLKAIKSKEAIQWLEKIKIKYPHYFY